MFAHQSPLVRARLSKELLTPTFALSTTPTLSSSRPPSPPPPESSWIFRHLKHRNTRMSDRRQTLDSLFVLDFEATCDQPRQTRPQEIIEFPCIKLRLAPGGGSGSAAPVPPMETARFHRYVRPVVHPHISDLCTELTGITQDMVENEEDFATTFRMFNDWLRRETADLSESFAFVTCGDWDLKTMLPGQCKVSGLDPPSEEHPHFRRWINVKRSCHSATGTFPRGMMATLRLLGMERFEGRQHSGIDDCQNIARAVAALVARRHVFEVNNS